MIDGIFPRLGEGKLRGLVRPQVRGGGGGGGRGSGGAGRGVAQRSGSGGGQRQQQQRSRETPSPQQLREWYAGRQRGGGAGPCTYIPRWGDLSRAGVAVFDLDYDAILAAMYALSTSDEGDCYLCVPPDPGIEAAALGAGETAALGARAYAAPGAGESVPSGTASAQVLHTFTLDSGASRSFFRDRTTLTPLSLYLPSFSTNLVSGADLQDQGVDQFTPASQRVTHCTCARTGRHLATFTRRPGSSLYTLSTESPPVSASGQVAASSLVLAAASGSGPESAPCSCHLLSHQTLLWYHRLGHPSLPRLRGMASCVLGHERYTTVFPLRSKGEVTEVLIDWIRAARLRLRESFGSDFPVLRLHSNRGGEFSSALLGAFCRAQGIRQTFTLPASPQQNGIAERRIGMVMDIARTSMIHAAAPHFLWPFATGKVGDASAFRVWGSRVFVRDLSADKLSPRAVPCRFDFTYSSPQATPLSTRHSLSALPSDESVEPSGPYPELVGCLMYLMTCTRPDLAYPLSILARYVAPGRHRPEHMAAVKRVLRYLCSTSGMGLVLGGRRPVVLTGHADASWADDQATQRSSQGYTFSLSSGSVSWRSTRSSSVLSYSCEAEIYAGAMAAQELRWLTYLLTDLGEQPRSPPVLYVDNKAMLALCREHRLEHRTKHIALRYFLAREL
ncbi:unnamed protein product [Closterium sp. NIES-54]